MDKIRSINDGVSLRVLFIFASFSYALKQCKITQNILNDNMFNEYIDYDDVYTGRFIKYPSQLAAAVESCQNIHLPY